MNAFTHSATLGGETINITPETFEQDVAALVARHPDAGVPDVRPIVETPPPDPMINQSGKRRAERDEQTARDNGFVMARPLYEIGTKVDGLGVENARASQLAHEQKPTARDVCRSLQAEVLAEARQDRGPLTLQQMRLSMGGDIAVGSTPGDRFIETARYGVEQEAFGRLAARCIPAKSAGAYLSDSPPHIRASNWSHWAKLDDGQQTHVLRTRVVSGERQVFSAVSETYTPFDLDKVAQAAQLAFPDDAKGVADYDGRKYRVEGLWHSDVAPEEFVAGEVFKAGVLISGDDTGSGSIRVRSVVWRNLCRNLLILDKAVGVDVRIRHVGDVRKLAINFQTAFGKALRSVDGFRHAWGAAMAERDERLIERVQGTTSDDITGLPVSAVLAGIFQATVQRDLVPVRGRTADVVPKLLEMHARDEAADAYGVSRASIVNAFTRYAHEVEPDPFAADQIREAAGGLLPSRGRRAGTPLPFEAFQS